MGEIQDRFICKSQQQGGGGGCVGQGGWQSGGNMDKAGWQASGRYSAGRLIIRQVFTTTWCASKYTSNIELVSPLNYIRLNRNSQ